MPSNLVTLMTTLEFLESAKRNMCQKHMDSYMNCIKNKKTYFQDCHILHMEKYETCMKSHIIMKKNKNDS